MAFTVCVFCGSSPGASPRYLEAAEELAKAISANSWSLVYGGGARGLMGSLARAMVILSGPTSVHGFIPAALIKTEIGVVAPEQSEYGQTTVVSSMHERKSLMAQKADAFLALPGGYGTVEELFETITWSQLGIHDRPVVLFNVNGFFDSLIHWITQAENEGFISKGQLEILSIATTAEEAIEKIKDYTPAYGRHLLDWSAHSPIAMGI